MWPPRLDIGRTRLSSRFALASAVILLVGALGLGAVVTRGIETSVMQRVAADAALYVDALLAPFTDALGAGRLSPQQRTDLAVAVERARRGGTIASVKVWTPDGEVVYASDATLAGKRLMSGGLAAARGGSVITSRSALQGEENTYERTIAPVLIETYIPLRESASGRVVAVAEFYQLPALLDAELDRARLMTWGVIAVATLAMYLLLAGIVKRGSDTIEWQRRALEATTERLRELSASRAETDEDQRRRIARELHDGVTQNLATALLTLGPDETRGGRLARIAIESALVEAQTLARGLALPQLAALDLGAVAERACSDHERRIGRHVPRHIGAIPTAGSVALKNGLYRVLQEALANTFRHAPDAVVSVRVAARDGVLVVECADRGPGLGPRTVDGLGIRGMRERVELLGGRIDFGTAEGGGTLVTATLPLAS